MDMLLVPDASAMMETPVECRAVGRAGN